MQPHREFGVFRFAADENFNRLVVNGLQRRDPRIDVVRAQGAGLSGANDASILSWAAGEGRVLLTHDAAAGSPSDLVNLAYQRASEGHAMPGVIVSPITLSVGEAIEEILLVSECSLQGELEGVVMRLRA